MKNIEKIEHIKTSIVHGRYDFICTPAQAFRLHSKLKKSKLSITIAGHSASDSENKKALIRELKRITS
jgi:proline iminopeptidase